MLQTNASNATRRSRRPERPVASSTLKPSTRSWLSRGRRASGRRTKRSGRSPWTARTQIAAAKAAVSPAAKIAAGPQPADAGQPGSRAEEDDQDRQDVIGPLDDDGADDLRRRRPGPLGQRDDAGRLAGPGGHDVVEQVADHRRRDDRAARAAAGRAQTASASASPASTSPRRTPRRPGSATSSRSSGGPARPARSGRCASAR